MELDSETWRNERVLYKGDSRKRCGTWGLHPCYSHARHHNRWRQSLHARPRSSNYPRQISPRNIAFVIAALNLFNLLAETISPRFACSPEAVLTRPFLFRFGP